MEPRISRDAVTSNVMAWGVPAANMLPSEDEALTEADEPPEQASPKFARTSIRKQADHQQSLLTKALQKESEDEESSRPVPGLFGSRRRRSMNSTVSLASTADLTSDTGITSPARTNTPSPPPMELRLVRLDSSKFAHPRNELVSAAVAVTDLQAKEEPIKKRSISFACMGKPTGRTSPTATTSTKQAAVAPEIVAPAPRRPCIRFACALKPGAEAAKPRPQTPPPPAPAVVETAPTPEPSSPATIRKARSPSHNGRVSPGKTSTPRITQSPTTVKGKKYLEASSNDFQYESSRFYEFASDEPQEDDWIRRDSTVARAKITINDTLLKENNIRRIGKEAEEEAELEEQEANGEQAAAAEDEDEDRNEEDNELDQGLEDEFSGYDSDDDGSDGYHQDEEIGFADSGDEEDDGDDGFWTPSRAIHRSASAEAAFARRPDMAGSHSDSSAVSASHLRTMRKHKAQRIKIRPGTPELPDSTDFVCGTFDEDRPLEDAYLSCMAQKKREKLHPIPQDIDPSFPTSDPEEEEEERFNPVHHGSDDHDWMHGDMEDIHHEQERGRRKSNGRISPRRFHSPPPKRMQSPPPKTRGRSPKPLGNVGGSPRRLRSPLPARMIRSPTVSPTHGARAPIPFRLGSRPELTQATKSLPRDPALFPRVIKAAAYRKGKFAAANANATAARPGHVRGAIDIVKGLEQKRQRRKEKYYQKYCHRARKGQIPDRRPIPGHGAERMRELGLLMAGKAAGHGNYVLSV